MTNLSVFEGLTVTSMRACSQTSSLAVSVLTIKIVMEKKKRKKEEANLIFLGNNVMTDQDILRHNQLLQSAEVHI